MSYNVMSDEYPASGGQSTYVTGGATWSYGSGGLNAETWTGPSNVSLGYWYDDGGNLTAIRNSGNTLHIDPLSDRILSADLPNYSTLSYDLTGEMTAFNGNTVAYNPLGQLATLSGTATNLTSDTLQPYSQSMIYDHLGLRTAITESTSTGQAPASRRSGVAAPMLLKKTDTQFFQYDGDDLIYRAFATTSTTTPLIGSDVSGSTGENGSATL